MRTYQSLSKPETSSSSTPKPKTSQEDEFSVTPLQTEQTETNAISKSDNTPKITFQTIRDNINRTLEQQDQTQEETETLEKEPKLGLITANAGIISPKLNQNLIKPSIATPLSLEMGQPQSSIMTKVIQRMIVSSQGINPENSLFAQRVFRVQDASIPTIQADFEQKLNSARGGGSPLDQAFQARVEPAMGADFSRVRIHTDSEADRLSQSIQAKAFTTGQDIFFRKGEYQPESRGGQELLAHELTHVVQQKGSLPSNLPKNTNHLASEKTSGSIRRNISPVSTLSIQASFISFVVKMGAKKASLAILKKFIKEQIKDKITKIAIKKFTKQFAKEADDLLSILEDPWWVTAIGFIPVIGDVFDFVHVPKQIQKAISKANALEERVKKILRIQGMKAGGLIPAKLKNVKDYPVELEGRTYAEIVDLASGSSNLADKAKTMKKLIEQTHRLMEKI
jgi:hypothetical protein